MGSIARFHSTYLLKIADKPMIFYVIESLANLGVRHFDIILRPQPYEIEEALGDGKRWGVGITYHLATYENYPLMPIYPALDGWSKEKLIIAEGDSLPCITLKDVSEDCQAPCRAFFYANDQWSGWWQTEAETLKAFTKKITQEALQAWIITHAQKKIIEPLFSTQTLQDLLKANLKAISATGNSFLLPSSAQNVEMGLWLSRGISLHPTVTIEPPVFIGDFCQIRPGVHLGPYAVIENRCIIDADSKIRRSVICQNSYVGEKLDVHESIVDRNLLVNLTHETSIIIREDFILSDLARRSISMAFFSWIGRLAALVLFAVLSPLYIYLKATCPVYKTFVVCLPAADEPSEWSYFEWTVFQTSQEDFFNKFKNYFKSLPLLLLLMQGKVHFVGVAPRSREDILKLPLDWQKLFLKSKIGLITLAKLDFDSSLSEDEQYASEAYYSTHMSIGYDFKLFLRWLKKKLSFKVWA